MPATDKPRRILECFKGGLINMMKLGEANVRIRDVPLVDRNWYDPFNIQVVPGHCRAWGGGDGAQDGGALLRAWTITIHLYMRRDFDQYEQVDYALLQRDAGMEDRKEQVRAIFEYTTLPNRAMTEHLLFQPAKWVANPATTRPDIKEHWIKGAVEFEVYYASSLRSVTLYQEDCVVPDPASNA